MTANNQSSNNPITITEYELTNQHELGQIEAKLQDGNILFVKTRNVFDLYQDEIVVLKNLFEKLQRVCNRYGGSMGRIGKNLLVLTPNKQIKLY